MCQTFSRNLIFAQCIYEYLIMKSTNANNLDLARVPAKYSNFKYFAPT